MALVVLVVRAVCELDTIPWKTEVVKFRKDLGLQIALTLRSNLPVDVEGNSHLCVVGPNVLELAQPAIVGAVFYELVSDDYNIVSTIHDRVGCIDFIGVLIVAVVLNKMLSCSVDGEKLYNARDDLPDSLGMIPLGGSEREEGVGAHDVGLGLKEQC